MKIGMEGGKIQEKNDCKKVKYTLSLNRINMIKIDLHFSWVDWGRILIS